MNGSRRVGARPMSAAATAAGTSSIGIRPWKVSRSPTPELVAERLEGSFGVAPTVDLEARIEIGAPRGQAGDRPDRDVDLVGGSQAARVDQPQRAIRAERPGRVGRGVEPRERRAVDDDRDLVRPDAQAEQPVAHRRIDRQRPRRDGDRQALLEQEQAVEGGIDGTWKALLEELRHRLVEIEDERHARQPERQRCERQEVRQRMDLDEPEPMPSMEAGGRPRRAGEELEVLAQVDAEPGSLVALDVEPVEPDARHQCPAAAWPGRRRPSTTTGRPVATSDSASRRTRGSSS